MPAFVPVRPAPYAPRVAVRAFAVVLTALLILWRAGHLDLAAYATFGAFTLVYGGGIATRQRWKLQAALGGVFALSALAGWLVAGIPGRWWVVLGLGAPWAALAAVLSDGFHWRPPGPMLPVFAFVTCASIPRASLLGPATTVVVAGLAVAMGIVEARLFPVTEDVPEPHRPTRRRRVVQAVRCAAAVLIAGGGAEALGVGHSYWAMVTALVPLAVPGVRAQLTRAAERGAGTVLGVAAGATLLLLPWPTLALLVVVSALQGAIELFAGTTYALALVFVTSEALLLARLASSQPVGELVFERVVETFLGLAVGSLLAVVTRDRKA